MNCKNISHKYHYPQKFLFSIIMIIYLNRHMNWQILLTTLPNWDIKMIDTFLNLPTDQLSQNQA